jgi:diguanylate cyclase (GGDEF)-like protein
MTTMDQIGRLITVSIPNIIFNWRQQLRSARGEEFGDQTTRDRLSDCLILILSETASAVAGGTYDIDMCAEAARRFGAIRHQQEIKASRVVREFCVLRESIWEIVSGAEDLDAVDLLAAKQRAETVLDEAVASAVDSLVEKVKIENTEYDPLTCLYSRALFHRELEIELQRSSRFRRRFALIMLSINVTLPPQANTHEAFDLVVGDLSRLMKDKLRKSDRMFRYENLQFAVLCPETDTGGLQTLCQRIAMDIAQYRQRTGLDVDIQYGAASYPSDAQNSLSLIRVALADQTFHQIGIEC